MFLRKQEGCAAALHYVAKLLLIRHADAGAGKRLIGRLPGWHLCPAGLAQAISLATALSPFPIRAVYSSPLERALETAQILGEPHGLTPEFLEDLEEVDFGEWEGRYLEELEGRADWRQFHKCRSGSKPPNGESMIDVQHRMIRCLSGIAARHPGENVIVVSHGDPLRCAIAHYLGTPLDLIDRFEVAFASVTAIELRLWGPCIGCLNFTNTFAGVRPEEESEVSYGSKNVPHVV